MVRSIQFILLIAAIFSQVLASVAISLPEDEVNVSVLRGVASFEDIETFGQPGEPDLPVYHAKILVSPDADLKTVSVHIENMVEEVMPGTYNVDPASIPVTSNGTALRIANRSIVDGRDQAVYSTNELFPKSWIRSVKVGKLRSYKIVDATIQRFRYNPVSGKLYRLKSGDVVVKYDTNSNLRSSFSITENTKDIAKDITCNFDNVGGSYSALETRGVGDYVILTTSSFKSSSTKLSKFASIKENDGFNVTILTENDWGGGSGATAVQNIRSWLISNEPEYVFIIGDPQKSSTIPMVDGPHASVKTPLTDFCYADLNGMYYEDGETRYYEYSEEGISRNRFDQYPEIHVGRLPVYNGSISDVEMLLQRMIDYMTESKADAESYRFNAVMPLNTFNDAQNGICFGEEVRTRILDPNNYSYKRIYYNHAGTSAEFPCSYEKTVQVWNAGKFGIMCLQGHGLVHMAEKAIDVSSVAHLSTDGYVHGFNISCNNGRPQDPGNLGFAIMKKAGISQIASAVEIWYSTTSISNFGTGATGNDYAFSYIDNLANFQKGAGACFSKTRSTQILSSENDWQNHVELNLYGCPAIGLYTYGVNDQVANEKLVNNAVAKKITGTVTSSGLIQFNGINGLDNSSIEIYDSRGKLINEICNVKSDKVTWNPNKTGASNGLYFAKIKTGKNNVSTVKILLK